MNCHQVLENLSAFIDNELDADQTNAIKAHLIRCSSCRLKRDTMEEIGRRIRCLPPITAPDDFQFKIYAGIRRHEAKQTQRHFWRWQTVVIPAMALLIGVVIGFSSDSMLNFSDSKPVAAVAGNAGIKELTTALTLADDGVIYDYSLDRYIQGSLIPVTVDTIPDSSDPTGRAAYQTPSSNESPVYPQSQYVLDNIPMRVNYERTIY